MLRCVQRVAPQRAPEAVVGDEQVHQVRPQGGGLTELIDDAEQGGHRFEFAFTCSGNIPVALDVPLQSVLQTVFLEDFLAIVQLPHDRIHEPVEKVCGVFEVGDHPMHVRERLDG
ncbi:Uncharacterised protein [Mycobacteroides abscessus subsp. abscessus]|nr:Uncharacterised protein [Mycobacteroides abscessus subsp. abscessus]